MGTKFFICIAVLSVLLFSCTESSIHSSRKQLLNEPRLINIDLGRSATEKYFHVKARRSTTSQDSVPNVTVFDLKNDTSHNQALIHWSGNSSRVIFILTRKKTSTGMSLNRITDSTLWRSIDYGQHYKLMMGSFSPDTVLKSYFISPSDKRRVIFVDSFNKSRRIWRSEDEGATYKKITVPFSVEKIEFHPEKSDLLLGYDLINRELFCSMNFGETWTRLGEEVTSERYFWYVKGVDTGKDADKIVHFEYRHIYYTIVKRIYKVKTCYVPNCIAAPFQRFYEDLENIDQDSLVVQDDYVFVQKSGAADKLYVSYKRGPFFKALFPYFAGEAQSHFHIVSSDGGCVIVGINHNNGLTHLYISDVKGRRFRQSLSNVRYFNKKTSNNRVFTIDIYEIQGIIGTYVANVHQPNGYNTTKITWNNGQSWSNITSNVEDENGKNMGFCSGCSLNLHLSMEQTTSGYYMQSILAKKSYPGLIIAHGTFGRTVEDNPNNVQLFISRDNGKSWKFARKKRHFVVATNHGSVIVAVKMIFLKPVDELSFSSDYGNTWTTLKFSDQLVNVDGMLTEPGETTSHITLFGHKTYADSWRIFQINMAPLLSRSCSYPTDFENVTLPSQTAGTCHLGMIQKVERLAGGQLCIINRTYSRIVNKDICDCTMKDYECDLGYKPSTDGRETCEEERNGLVDNIADIFFHSKKMFDEKAKCLNGMRNVSSGFRRIPGDQCKKDMPHIFWRLKPCGTTTTHVMTTTKLHSNVKIELINTTQQAKMGQIMIFSVQGAADSDIVVWHVLRLQNKARPTVISAKPNRKNFTFVPDEPGPYKVRAELRGTEISSDWILVKFWYPIERIFLYHPPVVQKSKPYNATVWTQTVFGLRGNHTLLGEVDYTWRVKSLDGSAEKSDFVLSRSNTYCGRPSSKVQPLKISVSAENPVSHQSTTGNIDVKEFVVTLVMEMELQPELNHSEFYAHWLEEFRPEVIKTLFMMPNFMKVKKKYELTNDLSLFVYIPPGDLLQVFIYFAPMADTDTKESLLQAAMDVGNVISKDGFSIPLANNIYGAAKRLYVVDYDGSIHIFQKTAASGTNGAVIATIVILVLVIVVAAVFLIRRYARRIRFDRYLHFRNLRPGSSAASHIVRNHDRSPFVDEEFIDDDLNTMEEIGNQDATLQFQG